MQRHRFRRETGNQINRLRWQRIKGANRKGSQPGGGRREERNCSLSDVTGPGTDPGKSALGCKYRPSRRGRTRVCRK